VKDSPLKKVKLGFGEAVESRMRKSEIGFFKKLGIKPAKMIREFSSTGEAAYTVGQELKADFFRSGDYVDVTGTSIGKGFQGGMKRWGWHGGPGGHGSMHHRRVGSIGSSTDPSRTYPGKHMPGHMGAETSTAQSLRVMDVDTENNVILVTGAVPGHRNGYVMINRSEKRKYRSLDEKPVVVVHKVNPMKQSKAAAKTAKPAKPKK
jgi:large subunit ribosomal protein L3